mgnify:CR=1 FL=1
MSEVNKHAENINESEWGTITVEYESNKGVFTWFTSKSHKPKNAKNIHFSFTNDKYVTDKNSVSNIKYLNLVDSINSPCPLVITNNSTATTFLKIVSTIKQDTDQIKLNYILSNLKILKSHPSFPNIVYSEYNCIYRSQSNSNVIELACIYDGKDSTRFIFAYNSKQIKKEEIMFILLKILCNNF